MGMGGKLAGCFQRQVSRSIDVGEAYSMLTMKSGPDVGLSIPRPSDRDFRTL